MELQDGTQILTRLGLTPRQARVYLALVQSGLSSVKEISKFSNVPREDLYRILSALQKLSLVEKTITTPTRFKATPIEDAVFFLLQGRIKETSELQEKARDLVKYVAENKAKPTLQEENQQLVLIPAKEAAIRSIRDSIETAQTSIDVVTLWSRFSSTMFAYDGEYKKALKRGVKMRYITESPEDKKSLAYAREIAQNFKEYRSFKVRYMRLPIKTVVAIIDKKKVYVFTSPSPELDGSPFLLSNNLCLIELAQNYFEMMWNAAVEDKD